MKNFIQEHRNYFIIALAVVVIVPTIIIFLLSLKAKPAQTKQNYHLSPTSAVMPARPVTINLDDAAEGRLAQVVLHRPPLSPADSQAKTSMLNAMLGGPNSGVLFISEDVELDYVKSENVFMGDIKTTNINQAKTEVTTWLEAQGISKEGICKLPVMFYLDPLVKPALQGQTVTLNPLPLGC